MTTLDDLAAIARGPYTPEDPDGALAHLYRVAKAGVASRESVDLAARTLLPLLDLNTEPARQAPPVRFDDDGDVGLVPGYERDWYGIFDSLGEDYVMRGADLDSLERYADFLHAAVRLRRDRDRERTRLATEHHATIEALRAAGWTVTEP